LRDLYRGIGDTLKTNFSGFTAWIITPNAEAVKYIGLRPSRKIELYNGPIETKFMRFDLYEGSKKEKYNSDSERPKRIRIFLPMKKIAGDLLNPDQAIRRNWTAQRKRIIKISQEKEKTSFSPKGSHINVMNLKIQTKGQEGQENQRSKFLIIAFANIV